MDALQRNWLTVRHMDKRTCFQAEMFSQKQIFLWTHSDNHKFALLELPFPWAASPPALCIHQQATLSDWVHMRNLSPHHNMHLGRITCLCVVEFIYAWHTNKLWKGDQSLKGLHLIPSLVKLFNYTVYDFKQSQSLTRYRKNMGRKQATEVGNRALERRSKSWNEVENKDIIGVNRKENQGTCSESIIWCCLKRLRTQSINSRCTCPLRKPLSGGSACVATSARWMLWLCCWRFNSAVVSWWLTVSLPNSWCVRTRRLRKSQPPVVFIFKDRKFFDCRVMLACCQLRPHIGSLTTALTELCPVHGLDNVSCPENDLPSNDSAADNCLLFFFLFVFLS